MKGIKINWGVFENIEEDLNKQGYSLGEKRKIWEKTKEARSLLTIKGFLTEAESQKVVNRMAKAISKDIIKLENNELEKQVKKEEPRYLLQTDLTSENGVQYLSFDKKRREYFMGALMTSENVQQKFTDSEISKIKSITRFVEFCEKVEVEE